MATSTIQMGKKIGTVSDVYWGAGIWTAPKDGVLVLRIVPSASNWYLYINDTTINATVGSWSHQFSGTAMVNATHSIPVKRGASFSNAGSGNLNKVYAFFYPFE